MPNWIQGTLKVRGKRDDILRFLKEGFGKSAHYATDEPMENFVNIYYDKDCKFYHVAFFNTPYVEGTKRAFIDTDREDCEIWMDADKEIIILAIPIMQAWSFKTEDWVPISERFNIDIRLFGFECGGQFGQEIEILKGKITKDEELTYEDWEWDCPFPNMGG